MTIVYNWLQWEHVPHVSWPISWCKFCSSTYKYISSISLCLVFCVCFVTKSFLTYSFFHLHLLYQPYLGLCQAQCVQSHQRQPMSAVPSLNRSALECALFTHSCHWLRTPTHFHALPMHLHHRNRSVLRTSSALLGLQAFSWNHALPTHFSDLVEEITHSQRTPKTSRISPKSRTPTHFSDLVEKSCTPSALPVLQKFSWNHALQCTSQT